jgi:hypothetical protein
VSHSFDSTLLQRMGFKDPDRGTPNHDRACIEIATKPHLLTEALGCHSSSYRSHAVDLEVPLQKGDGKYASTVGFIDAMVTVDVGEEDDGWWRVGGNKRWGVEFSHNNASECATWTERTVEKSSYSMFANNGLGGSVTRQHKEGTCHCSRETFCGPNTRFWRSTSLLVEVKSAIESVGDLLRQMNLYREYKQEHRARDGRRSQPTTFAIWSLRADDRQFGELLASQGYRLVVGASIDALEATWP